MLIGTLHATNQTMYNTPYLASAKPNYLYESKGAINQALNVYMEENKNIREENNKQRAEIKEKNETIKQLKEEIQKLQQMVNILFPKLSQYTRDESTNNISDINFDGNNTKRFKKFLGKKHKISKYDTDNVRNKKYHDRTNDRDYRKYINNNRNEDFINNENDENNDNLSMDNISINKLNKINKGDNTAFYKNNQGKSNQKYSLGHSAQNIQNYNINEMNNKQENKYYSPMWMYNGNQNIVTNKNIMDIRETEDNTQLANNKYMINDTNMGIQYHGNGEINYQNRQQIGYNEKNISNQQLTNKEVPVNRDNIIASNINQTKKKQIQLQQYNITPNNNYTEMAHQVDNKETQSKSSWLSSLLNPFTWF